VIHGVLVVEVDTMEEVDQLMVIGLSVLVEVI